MGEEKEIVEAEVVDSQKEVKQALAKIEKIDEEKEKELREFVEPMRVNFEDAQSVLNYGSEIIDEVVELLHNISASNNEISMDTDMTEYSEAINKVVGFTDVLQNEADKPSHLPARTQKKVFKFINNIFKTDLKMEEVHFHELFENQQKNIDEVAEIFKRMAVDSKRYATMNQDFINEMKPYVEKLGMLITVGYEDLIKYQSEIEQIRKVALNDASIDPNAIVLLDIKANKFGKKLINLSKTLTSYKQTQIKLGVGIYNKFEIVSTCHEILDDTLPALRIESKSSVDAMIDKINIQKQIQFKEAINKALEDTAKMTQQNTKDALQLSKEGIIKVDTYEKVGKTLQDTLKLINKSIMETKDIEKDRAKLKKTMESVQNEYRLFETLVPNVDEDQQSITEQKANVLIRRLDNKNKGLKNK